MNQEDKEQLESLRQRWDFCMAKLYEEADQLLEKILEIDPDFLYRG